MTLWTAQHCSFISDRDEVWGVRAQWLNLWYCCYGAISILKLTKWHHYSHRRKKGDLFWSSLFPRLPLSSIFFVCILSRKSAFVRAISQWNKEQQLFISVLPTLRQQNLCSSVAVHVSWSLESLLDHHVVHCFVSLHLINWRYSQNFPGRGGEAWFPPQDYKKY